MNFIAKLQDWVKTLPPPIQTVYYSVETAFVVALSVFFVALYGSIQADKPFDWHAQVHILWLALAGGIVKGVIDLLKAAGGAGPTQEPAPPKVGP